MEKDNLTPLHDGVIRLGGRRSGRSFFAYFSALSTIQAAKDMEEAKRRVAESRTPTKGSHQWSSDEKDLAYKIDPECWVSYSSKNREFKRAMDKRRLLALTSAAKTLVERTEDD